MLISTKVNNKKGRRFGNHTQPSVLSIKCQKMGTERKMAFEKSVVKGQFLII